VFVKLQLCILRPDHHHHDRHHDNNNKHHHHHNQQTQTSVSATQAASIVQLPYATCQTIPLVMFRRNSRLHASGLIANLLGSVPGDSNVRSFVARKVPLTQLSFRILFDFPLLIAIAVLLHNQLQP